MLRANSCDNDKTFTFIPTLTAATDIRYELLKIRQRWENLMERHGESQKLIDLPVLTANTMQEIYLPDVAQDKDVPHKIVMESSALRLDTADDKDVLSYYKHTAKLQLNRDYASLIASDIISAKTYAGSSPLLYVLLKYDDKYHVLLYDPKTETVRSPEPEKILGLIECTPDTEKPWVEAEVIEELSDACLRTWCAQNNVGEQEIIRECALYLKPESEEDCVKSWLNPQQDAPSMKDGRAKKFFPEWHSFSRLGLHPVIFSLNRAKARFNEFVKSCFLSLTNSSLT